MKYAIGFLVGVIATATFFTLKLQKMAASKTESFQNTNLSAGEAERMPADFETFYVRFHDDSLYQLTHVLFPLRGLPTNADSLTVTGGNFHWQESDWKMHQPFNSKKGEYQRNFLSLGDVITEDISTKDGFGMQRRFMKTDGEWYLIFYSAMNKMR
ncbi:MAG: hypothetical protein ACI8VT_002418 [Saprospiraceae bacterium]|jgi:hypothetical protein